MSIVVDADMPDEEVAEGREALTSWVLERVDQWRTHRDTQHAGRWDEYYRIWRGMFAENDKTRKSERSKIVSPATMQAVDSTVAEIEEAVFGRETWVDVLEDEKEKRDPQERDEMIAMRDQLLERMEKAKVPSACAQSFLMGAIYGTAVGKINTSVRTVKRMGDDRREYETEEAHIELIALEPYEFVPDPTTDDIDEMLGMAHETVVPLHTIRKGQKEGIYRDTVSVEAWTGERPGDTKDPDAGKLPDGGGVLITEYHGLVPAKYLMEYLGMEDDGLLEDADPEDVLIEAIITIANKGTLLGAKKNPFYKSDRCFISYQHDCVPRYFWGRGVPEKGYHPQKGLDAELRARLDALGLISHPMVAGDVTRLPRGMNLGVWPGKFWPTTGNPSEILQPFSFGQLNPASFPNAQDMERMVSMATGAMDPNAGYSANQQSASNTAINSSAFIKRARRTMQNIERRWLRPLVEKMMLRYMQFDPENFPYDPHFVVKGTLGVMAREFEQQQLIQMLSLVPNESPPFLVLLKAVFDNSSSPHKADMVKAVDAMLQPPDEEAQREIEEAKALQKRQQIAIVAELEAKAAKAEAEAQKAQAMAQKALAETDLLDDEITNQSIKNAIDLKEVQAFEEQNAISREMSQIRSIELAIKAMQAQASIMKAKADAAKIRSAS